MTRQICQISRYLLHTLFQTWMNKLLNQFLLTFSALTFLDFSHSNNLDALRKSKLHVQEKNSQKVDVLFPTFDGHEPKQLNLYLSISSQANIATTRMQEADQLKHVVFHVFTDQTEDYANVGHEGKCIRMINIGWIFFCLFANKHYMITRVDFLHQKQYFTCLLGELSPSPTIFKCNLISRK